MPVLSQLVRLLRQMDAPDGPSSITVAVLRRLERDGAARVTDLARLEKASQPGMTQLVGRLERATLVRRVPDPNDRRGVRVEVTGDGLALLARTQARHAASLDLLWGRLDDADRDAIAAALPALGRLVRAADVPVGSA